MQVPVVIIVGGQPNLKPETAKNWTFGLDYKPPVLKDLQLSLNYYDISYSGQLGVPPFSLNALSNPALSSVITMYPIGALQTLVNAAVANGAVYFDLTGGPLAPIHSHPQSIFTAVFARKT